MPRVSNPVITVDAIRSIQPGETIEIREVDEKKKSSIYTMVGYVREMGCPKRVQGYTCSYDATNKVCHITALPRGIDRKTWLRQQAEELQQEKSVEL